MSKLIAIVDDDPDILDIVSCQLNEIGFKTKEFKNAQTFLVFLQTSKPDLVILDIKLPDRDGFEVCKMMKQNKKYNGIPIIMLTGKGSEIDKVLGLELGADDYVTKPFSSRELLARVKVILKRKRVNDSISIIEIGDILRIDPSQYKVTVEGKEIVLTTTEFRILKLLAEKPGWVFSRRQILDNLWGMDKTVVDRSVDVHIKNLKKKLGAARRFIRNIRGVGYKIQE